MGIDLDGGLLAALGAAPLSFLATVFVAAAGLADAEERTGGFGLPTAFFAIAFFGIAFLAITFLADDFLAALIVFTCLALDFLVLTGLAGADFFVPLTIFLEFFNAATAFLAATGLSEAMAFFAPLTEAPAFFVVPGLLPDLFDEMLFLAMEVLATCAGSGKVYDRGVSVSVFSEIHTLGASWLH